MALLGGLLGLSKWSGPSDRRDSLKDLHGEGAKQCQHLCVVGAGNLADAFGGARPTDR